MWPGRTVARPLPHSRVRVLVGWLCERRLEQTAVPAPEPDEGQHLLIAPPSEALRPRRQV